MKSEIFDQLVEFFRHFSGSLAAHEVEENLSEFLVSNDFNAYDVKAAIRWLKSFTAGFSNSTQLYSTNVSRVLSPEEKAKFSSEALSYLLSMCDRQSITSAHFELMVDKAMQIECQTIELRHVKWIGLMLLANSQQATDEAQNEENDAAFNPLLLELLNSTGTQVIH